MYATVGSRASCPVTVARADMHQSSVMKHQNPSAALTIGDSQHRMPPTAPRPRRIAPRAMYWSRANFPSKLYALKAQQEGYQADFASRGERLRHQGELRNELLAPRLRAEQQGDDEEDGGAARRDQHRDGKAERLIGGKVGQHWAREACPDCPLVVAEARCGRSHLGRKSFRQIARVLPVNCAEESTLHD